MDLLQTEYILGEIYRHNYALYVISMKQNIIEKYIKTLITRYNKRSIIIGNISKLSWGWLNELGSWIT
jgi:hypothetical protein